MAIFENIWVEEKFLTKISKFFSIFGGGQNFSTVRHAKILVNFFKNRPISQKLSHLPPHFE